MIRRIHILATVFLSFVPITCLQAQEHLPEKISIILGSGITLPCVEENRTDFFNENHYRAGYDLMTEGRYYFTPRFATGLRYDYLRVAYLPDKIHVHYVRPNITFRYLWNEGKKGCFLSLGIGYMNYQELMYKRKGRVGTLFQRGYCGLSLDIGYEFHIAKRISGMFRADAFTADWFANPDATLFNPDDYDDGVNHSWFKNNITFFNIGFAIQFGR